MLKQIMLHPAFKALVTAVLIVGLIHLISALTYDRVLQYREISVTSPTLPSGLDGYTAAFITDIHNMPRKKLEEIALELSGRDIDLLLLGGDYPVRQNLSDCMEILAGIGAKDGVYGVEGNHDNADRLRSAMERHGLVLLENSGARVRDGLYLAGTEDLWNRDPDAEKALKGAEDGDFVLMLCHNPDTSVVRDFSRANLTLAGHTHGGEMVLFGAWAPSMRLVSDYGQRFRSGWALTGAGTDIYVSNGVGKHFLFRVFSPPQVILVTLRSGDGARTS